MLFLFCGNYSIKQLYLGDLISKIQVYCFISVTFTRNQNHWGNISGMKNVQSMGLFFILMLKEETK